MRGEFDQLFTERDVVMTSGQFDFVDVRNGDGNII